MDDVCGGEKPRKIGRYPEDNSDERRGVDPMVVPIRATVAGTGRREGKGRREGGRGGKEG